MGCHCQDYSTLSSFKSLQYFSSNRALWGRTKAGAPARGGQGVQAPILEKIRVGIAHSGNFSRGLKTSWQIVVSNLCAWYSGTSRIRSSFIDSWSRSVIHLTATKTPEDHRNVSDVLSKLRDVTQKKLDVLFKDVCMLARIYLACLITSVECES